MAEDSIFDKKLPRHHVASKSPKDEGRNPMSQECVPFAFIESDQIRGPRFGGAPPAGVFPASESGRYLLSIPLLGKVGMEVSVFLNCDFDFILDQRGTILSDSSVEVRLHPESPRDVTRPADFLAFGLKLKPPVVEQDEISDHHKLGGVPYLIHPYEEDLESKVEELLAEGFVQILQLNFPAGADDCAVGMSWPFGDGLFHVFGKPPFDDLSWKWFWEID